MRNENRELFVCEVQPGKRIVVVHGDLTREAVDVIVNAANRYLAHGGGVAGAIVRRGGYVIQQESDAWVREHGPLATGEAAITGAGSLPARYVVHTVGPIWRRRGDEPALLRQAVLSALSRAEEVGARSVSLPAISSGIYGFPKRQAMEVIWAAVADYLRTHPQGSLEEVRLCNIDHPTVEHALAVAKARCPGLSPDVNAV